MESQQKANRAIDVVVEAGNTLNDRVALLEGVVAQAKQHTSDLARHLEEQVKIV